MVFEEGSPCPSSAGPVGGWTLAGLRCGFTWWVPHPPWTAHQPPFLGLLYRFKAFRNVEFLKTNSFISFLFLACSGRRELLFFNGTELLNAVASLAGRTGSGVQPLVMVTHGL